MFGKKIKITLTLTIILLFSIVSIAQAAPPLQGGKGISQGHALKLDANGNNLGAAVSGIKDQVQADDGRMRPAVALANHFNSMSYEEIMALHEGGVGFGKIAQALYFSEKFDLGMGTAELITKARQSGWGKTLRENGIHPGSIGKGHRPEHAGPKFDNGQGNGNHGQGLNNGNNGRGNGNNGNNGQGKGKGKNKGGSDEASVNSDDDDDAGVDNDDDATEVDNDDNGNGNGRGKGKGNNGNGNGKGNGNSKGKGNGNGNGNSHGNGNGNSYGNGNSNGNNGQGSTTDDDNTEDGGNEN